MQPSQIYHDDENISVDQTYNSKNENFDAANYNVPNVPIYSQALFPKYEEDRYQNLEPIHHICLQTPGKYLCNLPMDRRK